MKGVVKWVSHEEGYGFITPDGEGRDVAFFLGDVENADLLREGTCVVFEIFSNAATGKDVATDIRAFDGNRAPDLVPNVC